MLVLGFTRIATHLLRCSKKDQSKLNTLNFHLSKHTGSLRRLCRPRCDFLKAIAMSETTYDADTSHGTQDDHCDKGDKDVQAAAAALAHTHTDKHSRNRSWSTALFAVCARPVPLNEEEPLPIEGYLVVHPQTGELCSNRSFSDGYCCMPLLMDEAQAQALAQRLEPPAGHRWHAEQAPAPCAHCGRVIWADDRDFCYPLNRERTRWRAGCNEHDFGCGHEVEGDSEAEVMQAWSQRGERKKSD